MVEGVEKVKQIPLEYWKINWYLGYQFFGQFQMVVVGYLFFYMYNYLLILINIISKTFDYFRFSVGTICFIENCLLTLD